MGGASRNDRQRRQAAANQRLAAAGIVPTKKGPTGGTRVALIVVGVVVVLAALGGYLYSRSSSSAPTPTYAVAADGTVVAAGQQNAPVTVDVYEDYLCPFCERFETIYHDEVTTALNEGKIKVNYHSTAILDNLSKPAGYSTLAANAALCAVPAGIWPAYHKALFDDQPAENGPGLTAAQLVEKGTALGATGDWRQCVTGNGNATAIAAATAAAKTNPALLTNNQFGTPAVLVNGTKVDLNDRNWLKNAIAGK